MTYDTLHFILIGSGFNNLKVIALDNVSFFLVEAPNIFDFDFQ